MVMHGSVSGRDRQSKASGSILSVTLCTGCTRWLGTRGREAREIHCAHSLVCSDSILCFCLVDCPGGGRHDLLPTTDGFPVVAEVEIEPNRELAAAELSACRAFVCALVRCAAAALHRQRVGAIRRALLASCSRSCSCSS